MRSNGFLFFPAFGLKVQLLTNFCYSYLSRAFASLLDLLSLNSSIFVFFSTLWSYLFSILKSFSSTYFWLCSCFSLNSLLRINLSNPFMPEIVTYDFAIEVSVLGLKVHSLIYL